MNKDTFDKNASFSNVSDLDLLLHIHTLIRNIFINYYYCAIATVALLSIVELGTGWRTWKYGPNNHISGKVIDPV